MSASLIASIIVIAVLLSALVLVTALFLKAQREMLAHADRLHVRSVQHESSLLDRLMAMDFATFKSYEMSQNSPAGGYEVPDEEHMTEIIRLPGLEVVE